MTLLRDVMLTVMAFLVSLVCVWILYFALEFNAALSRLGEPIPAVTTTPDLLPRDDASTPPECVGEVPVPGC